jgi:hypothetical protein
MIGSHRGYPETTAQLEIRDGTLDQVLSRRASGAERQSTLAIPLEAFRWRIGAATPSLQEDFESLQVETP